MILKCPICKTRISDTDGGNARPAFFPFCSERCKLVDLSRWLDASYRMAAKRDDEDGQSRENN